MTMLTRRRAIGITAAAAGLALLPFFGAGAAEAEDVTWEGQALGAMASLRIHHHDRAQAEQLIKAAGAEVRRLERIFSLYRDDSELAALNRDGLRLAPSRELLEVLELSASLWALSEGAFDPTVQSLWRAYRAHFAAVGADAAGPPPDLLEDALARTGFSKVRFSPARIDFRRPGMALTLNGIAQGYITDRIVALLRDGGVETCLVDMGESRGVGRHQDGRGWRVGIANPREAGGIIGTLDLVDRAIATSSPAGFVFDAGARFTHLIDPRSGKSPRRYESVSVVAADAATADGLSTAFSLMEGAAIVAAMREHGGLEVHLLTAAGEYSVLGG